MEMNHFDVCIVSAFGRGLWLATELRREKMRVLVLDVTSRLGVWPPEDGEGPFGVFRLEKSAENFAEALVNGDSIEAINDGWTLWLPEGPVEMKGPLTRFHWEKMGFPLSWLDHLSRAQLPTGGMPAEFKNIWPLALACNLASTYDRPPVRALESSRPLPLSASFGIRFASRQGLNKNLQWVKDFGVSVTDKTDLLDVSFRQRREISGLELKGEWSGLVRIEQLVWCLTGGETQFLSPNLAEILYPGGVISAQWCWVRYRLTVTPCPELERLPLHVVMIHDLESPWTHENVMILQKTAVERSVDAWIRIPAVSRFNRDYLSEHGRRVIDVVNSRLPQSLPQIQSLPQEASYTFQELGEPRVPLWDPELPPWKSRLAVGNLYFESPENRENHSLDTELEHQKNLRDRLVKDWKLKQLKMEKQQRGQEA